MRRLFAVFYARNLEFLRDRTTVIWNFLFPIVVVVGMGLVFGSGARPLFEVGVLTAAPTIDLKSHPFLATRYVKFFTVADEDPAIVKVSRHQIDLLIDLRSAPPRYWVNSDSPKGYIVERLLIESDATVRRQEVRGEAVRYVDWLLPGVIGMNMMFNCLFGVGYVVVRYRKSGFLKRLWWRAVPGQIIAEADRIVEVELAMQRGITQVTIDNQNLQTHHCKMARDSQCRNRLAFRGSGARD